MLKSILLTPEKLIYTRPSPKHQMNKEANKTGTEINTTALVAGRGRETFLQFDISNEDLSRVQEAYLCLTTVHGGGNAVDVN